MKALTLGVAALSVLLVASMAVPAFASSASIRPDGTLGKGVWKTPTDNFGNYYKLKNKDGVVTGDIYASNTLPIPPDWAVTGTTNGPSFSFTATNPNPSNGACSFSATGKIKGPEATGTYMDIPTGSNTCTASGTFFMDEG